MLLTWKPNSFCPVSFFNRLALGQPLIIRRSRDIQMMQDLVNQALFSYGGGCMGGRGHRLWAEKATEKTNMNHSHGIVVYASWQP